MDYNPPKMIQLLNLSTKLDKTNLGQPIFKQCLILFSLWCKKLALVGILIIPIHLIGSMALSSLHL